MSEAIDLLVSKPTHVLINEQTFSFSPITIGMCRVCVMCTRSSRDVLRTCKRPFGSSSDSISSYLRLSYWQRVSEQLTLPCPPLNIRPDWSPACNRSSESSELRRAGNCFHSELLRNCFERSPISRSAENNIKNNINRQFMKRTVDQQSTQADCSDFCTKRITWIKLIHWYRVDNAESTCFHIVESTDRRLRFESTSSTVRLIGLFSDW